MSPQSPAGFLMERIMSQNRNIALAAVLSAVSVAATASEIEFLGTPPDFAVVGERYDYVPEVINAILPDLRFSYINRPGWSESYRDTGAIIGTPSEPGVYANIQIQAWDGVHCGVSAPFTITVASAADSADVRWVKPTLNTDGSPLTDLAGYLIRYGTSAAKLDTHFWVDSADVTAAEIRNLSPGNWYFEIASLTDADVRGPFSRIVESAIR
jgi:hypothetical protein